MRTRPLLTLALALSIMAPMAMAQEPGDNPELKDNGNAQSGMKMKHRGHKREGHGQYNLKAIQKIPSLTEDQKASLEKIQSELKTSTAPLREQMKAKHAESLKAKNAKGDAKTEDSSKEDKEAKKAAKAESRAKSKDVFQEIQAKRKAAWESSLAILKDDQKTELDNVLAQMKEKRQNRRANKGNKKAPGERKHKRAKLKENNLEQTSEAVAPSE